MEPRERGANAAAALREWCGIVVPANRWTLLDRELRAASGGEGPEAQLQPFLSGEPVARARLARTVATPETSLFRHPAHFRILAAVSQRLRTAGRPCRVLSAGCSTGEEAWSAGAVVAAANGGMEGRVVGWDLLDERGVLFLGPCDPVAVPNARWIHEIVDGARLIRARQPGDEARPHGARALVAAALDPLATGGIASPTRASAPVAPIAPIAPIAAMPAAPALVAGGSVGAGPARDPGVINRVQELADRGDYAAAMALLDAIATPPTAEDLKWRGVLSLNLGNAAGAVAALRGSTFLAPQDAEGRRWLAVAYETAGAGDRAGREWRNAQELEDAARLR